MRIHKSNIVALDKINTTEKNFVIIKNYQLGLSLKENWQID